MSLSTRNKKKEEKVCPIARVADIVGDLWVMLIVRDLLTGPKRFTELQVSLKPASGKHAINSRTLTSRLKTLEDEGVIERKAFPHEKPPKVEYSLTKRGKALSEIIRSLREYGNKYN
jgi:DNA-binding HxlR family transcriptional regulator